MMDKDGDGDGVGITSSANHVESSPELDRANPYVRISPLCDVMRRRMNTGCAVRKGENHQSDLMVGSLLKIATSSSPTC